MMLVWLASWMVACALARSAGPIVLIVKDFGFLGRLAARVNGWGPNQVLGGMAWFPPFVVVLDERDVLHETVHFYQAVELGVVLFYPLYVIGWLWRGYYSNPFERAAYAKDIRPYSWCRYLR